MMRSLFDAIVIGLANIGDTMLAFVSAPWRTWRRRRVRRSIIDEINDATEARRRQLNAIVAPPVSQPWINDHIYRVGKTGHRS
jgi:hypothetical protein